MSKFHNKPGIPNQQPSSTSKCVGTLVNDQKVINLDDKDPQPLQSYYETPQTSISSYNQHFSKTSVAAEQIKAQQLKEEGIPSQKGRDKGNLRKGEEVAKNRRAASSQNNSNSTVMMSDLMNQIGNITKTESQRENVLLQPDSQLKTQDAKHSNGGSLEKEQEISSQNQGQGMERIGEGYNTDDEKSSQNKNFSSASESSSSSSSSEGENQEYLDEQQFDELQDDSFYSEMTDYQGRAMGNPDSNSNLEKKSKQRLYSNIPPPNPLLPKTLLPEEKLKTGFSKRLIELRKYKVFESERARCTPIKQPQMKSQSSKNEYGQNQSQNYYNNSNSNSNNTGQDEGNPGSEQSLRHFFYLEYRKGQPGKFGKSSYEAEDKFCPDSFSQLVRTCNIKRLMKGLPGDMKYRQQSQYNPLMMKDYHRKVEDGILYQQQLYQMEPAPSRSYYNPTSQTDQTLVFESRFESGNLQLAHKVNDNEYNLILQNDINSKGHTQWFYFRVQNTSKNLKVKFNLLNFLKPKSLYNEGMKVLIFSEKMHDEHDKSWFRGGDDISYYQSNYRREIMANYQRCYYTFTFTYKFEHDNDTVFFAYSMPYTYSDLMDDLSQIEKMNLDYVSRNTLCRTIAGNRCDYLTITSRSNQDESNKNQQPKIQKKGVVISARVHPGETNGSWMMKGVIDFLIGDSLEAQILRNNFIFKIIPMLNPDGVINGNYRCSLAGCDLNRRWKYPSPILHPTIYSTKKLVKQFASERPLILFCDLHGHSRRKNVFMYGNSDPNCPEATRIFPFLMSKIAGPHFSYDYSRFKVQRNKEYTARITLWRELKIPNIFTMEASFCGPIAEKDTQNLDLNYHFTIDDLKEVGKNLCQTLLFYYKSEIDLDKQIVEIKQYHSRKNSTNTNVVNTTGQQQDTTPKRNDQGALKQPLQSKKNFESSKQQSKDPKLLISSESQASVSNPLSTNETAISSSTILTSNTLTLPKLKMSDIMTELKEKIKEERRSTIQEVDCESSSGGSDSEESEDNLDHEELIKIMPQRIVKKKMSHFKRKKNQAQNAIQPKRKEDINSETKKTNLEAIQVGPEMKKRNQSQRGICDFKKPTQSYLSKYSMIGKRNPYRPLRKNFKDRFTQTSDKDEGSDYELSAMEKDILKCTGCTPGPLRKIKASQRNFQQLNYHSTDHKKTRGSLIENLYDQKISSPSNESNLSKQQFSQNSMKLDFGKPCQSFVESNDRQVQVLYSKQAGNANNSNLFGSATKTGGNSEPLNENSICNFTNYCKAMENELKIQQLKPFQDKTNNQAPVQGFDKIKPQMINFTAIDKSGSKSINQILNNRQNSNQSFLKIVDGPSALSTHLRLEARQIKHTSNQNTSYLEYQPHALNNFQSQVIQEINNFSCKFKNQNSENLCSQTISAELQNQLVPSKNRMPYKRKVSHMFNQNQLRQRHISQIQLTQVVQQQPLSQSTQPLITQNSISDNGSQKILFPAMMSNISSGTIGSSQFMQKQLSPIVQITHNRLNQQYFKGNDAAILLEQIEERIGQRSASSNVYNRHSVVQRNNRINEIMGNLSINNQNKSCKEDNTHSTRTKIQSNGHLVNIQQIVMRNKKKTMRDISNTNQLINNEIGSIRNS